MAEGQAAADGEAMAVMGASRERIRGLGVLLDLHELARDSDLEGFRELIESPEVQQLVPVQGEEHLLALFEEAAKIDLSGAARGMEIHRDLIDTVGEDRYWTGVFLELARRLVAIELLRLAINDRESSPAMGLAWQDVREENWDSTVINLADAAPESITLSEVLLFVDGLHTLERDLLTR